MLFGNLNITSHYYSSTGIKMSYITNVTLFHTYNSFGTQWGTKF